MFDFDAIEGLTVEEVLRLWVSTNTQGERSTVIGLTGTTIRSEGLFQDLLLFLEHLTAMIKALSNDGGAITKDMVDMVQTISPLPEVYVYDYEAHKTVRVYKPRH